MNNAMVLLLLPVSIGLILQDLFVLFPVVVCFILMIIAYILLHRIISYVEALKERYPEGVDASFGVAGVKPTFDQAVALTKPKGNVVVIAIRAREFELILISFMTFFIYTRFREIIHFFEIFKVS